jgi:hypothetical protein
MVRVSRWPMAVQRYSRSRGGSDAPTKSIKGGWSMVLKGGRVRQSRAGALVWMNNGGEGNLVKGVAALF